DGQGPSIEQACLLEAALIFAKDREVVQKSGEANVARTESFPCFRESAPKQALRRAVSSLEPGERGQGRQRLGPNPVDTAPSCSLQDHEPSPIQGGRRRVVSAIHRMLRRSAQDVDNTGTDDAAEKPQASHTSLSGRVIHVATSFTFLIVQE